MGKAGTPLPTIVQELETCRQTLWPCVKRRQEEGQLVTKPNSGLAKGRSCQDIVAHPRTRVTKTKISETLKESDVNQCRIGTECGDVDKENKRK